MRVGRERGRERDEADVVPAPPQHRSIASRRPMARSCLVVSDFAAAEDVPPAGSNEHRIGVGPTGIEAQEVQEAAYAGREASAARN